MLKRWSRLVKVFSCLLALFLFSCVTMTRPTETSFSTPLVELDSVQVTYYEGFWTYGKAKTEKGKPPDGGGSSPITLEFVFHITNPNSYPVMLESSKFFLFFDDYELRVVNDNHPMWIPGGKRNTKVLNVTSDPDSS